MDAPNLGISNCLALWKIQANTKPDVVWGLAGRLQSNLARKELLKRGEYHEDIM